MTNVTFGWLKFEIYIKKVTIVTNLTFKRTHDFIKICSLRNIQKYYFRRNTKFLYKNNYNW